MKAELARRVERGGLGRPCHRGSTLQWAPQHRASYRPPATLAFPAEIGDWALSEVRVLSGK